MAAIGYPFGGSRIDSDRELSAEILKLIGVTMPVQKFRIEYEAGGLIKVSIDYFPSIAKSVEAVSHA